MLRRASVAFVAVLVSLALAMPTAGATGDEVRRRGPCDLGSEWRLIVRRETPTTLRVRYVIATGRAGETWSIFLSMNGGRLFAGQRTTSLEGYVRITRFPTDIAGDDTIKAVANNLANGETCSGALIYPY
jgi:hypothetical protein